MEYNTEGSSALQPQDDSTQDDATVILQPQPIVTLDHFNREMASLRNHIDTRIDTLSDEINSVRDNTYTKTDIDEFRGETDVKIAEAAKETEDRLSRHNEKVINQLGKKLEAMIDGFTTQLTPLATSIDNGVRLATEALTLAKQNASQIGAWGKINETQANQIQGLQRENDGIQAENRQYRNEVNFVRSEQSEMHERMNLVINSQNRTHAIVLQNQSDLAPMIAYFRDAQEQKAKREAFYKNLRSVAMSLIATPRGVAMLTGLITTLTGVEVATGAFTEFLHTLGF